MLVSFQAFCGRIRVRLSSFAINLIGTVLAAAISLATVPSVEAAPKFAAITIDAHNGRILFARNADAPRYPASLTKIMTLYLLFQDLEAHRIKFSSPLRVSKLAASRQPSKLGLRPGSTIRVRDAILALVTKSANDVATTVAEGLAGTESNFARRMTRTARALGMTRTTFANASGLPNRRQLTTARDMATLGLRIQKDFPRYYKYFRTRSFKYNGRRYGNHNELLGRLKGVDGIKTGYTHASGFNLTSSVKRNGKHIVGVVLGGRSGKSRNRYMKTILARALEKVPSRRNRQIASTAGKPAKSRNASHASTSTGSKKSKLLPRPTVTEVNGQITTQAKIISLRSNNKRTTRARNKQMVPSKSRTPENKPADATDVARGTTWQIQIGAFSTTQDALSGLAKARNTGIKLLKRKKALTLKVASSGNTLYRARFSGFNRRQAARTCNALTRRSIQCIAIAPRG